MELKFKLLKKDTFSKKSATIQNVNLEKLSLFLFY